MQMPIMDKDERVFRDQYIFAVDVKAINLESVLRRSLLPSRKNLMFLSITR